MFRVCLLIELILALSGCAIFSVVDGISLLGGIGALPLNTTSHPKILCTDEHSIGVSYQTEDSNNRHDEAMQLISEHCVRGYIEVNREPYYASSVNVYAMCLQGDGSPSDSQPCEYDKADENVGFGTTDPTIPDG